VAEVQLNPVASEHSRSSEARKVLDNVGSSNITVEAYVQRHILIARGQKILNNVTEGDTALRGGKPSNSVDRAEYQ
jgi:hypothetical protein